LFGEDKMTAPEVGLDPEVVAVVRAQLRTVSVEVVAAVVAQVPSYSRAFSGPMGSTIETMVELALGGFVDLAAGEGGGDPGSPGDPVHQGAYDLGRGEARSGRSMDALLAAYRVGARVAWRGLSDAAVTAGLSADRVVTFAELVFAYIDELSAVSVAGHSDELETTGRVRQRLLERLARLLLSEAPGDAVLVAADRAEWAPPETLTAVLLPPAAVRTVLAALGPAGSRTLSVTDDAPDGEEVVTLLVPDAGRSVLRRVLADVDAVLGPARPWLRAAQSHARAVRARALAGGATGGGPVDTDEHLVDLVLDADPDARVDLRTRALAPLADVRPASRVKLEETLRAWLLCQGRRDDVAGRLFVHPQTVRYRMGQLRELPEAPRERLLETLRAWLDRPGQVQAVAAALGVHPQTVRYRMGRLRELYGDRLTDPAAVRELLVALA
jgi:hypothetical protein